jgi:hypothetical protein
MQVEMSHARHWTHRNYCAPGTAHTSHVDKHILPQPHEASTMIIHILQRSLAACHTARG